MTVTIGRRDLLAALGGAAAAWPLAARAARRASAAHRVLPFTRRERSGSTGPHRSVSEGLETLGWTENRNIQIEHRFSRGDLARIQAYTAEVVSSSPDLIVATSSPVTAALKQATHTIPIVFSVVNDPVG
jgi:putative ABC transport system substrate-binding protein